MKSILSLLLLQCGKVAYNFPAILDLSGPQMRLNQYQPLAPAVPTPVP